MSRRINWPQAFAEVLLLVVGVGLAVLGDSLWDWRADREREARLLRDLIAEFEVNRDGLQRATQSHLDRATMLSTLVTESGSEREGLSSDSLRVLAQQAYLNPLFAVARGTTAEAVTGDGLGVIRDEQLRSDVAAFWDEQQYYFDNQERFVNVKLSEGVLYGTGSLVQPYPATPALGAHEMWSEVLTPDEVRAVKYFTIAEYLSELLASQGTTILADIDAMLVRLKAYAAN